jgi:serine/threonine-protein kinase
MTCQHCGREHPAGAPRCTETGELMSAPGLIGTRVDRYELQKLLGTGGFGAVYRARHVHTDAVVALKLLKKAMGADQAMLERFLREAKAAAAIGNEHIVGVHDAGVASDGQAFLALEFLDGMDLKELAYREAPLSPARLTALTVQMLDALSAAHARGIVHRDMKPANVFVVRRRDEQGAERDFVKLLDFGISKMHAEGDLKALTQTGMGLGTPAYMAPEQFFDARNVDGRADVYSVSVMLYELLSGKLPFDADSYAALIIKVQNEEPVALDVLAPSVPTALAQTVMVGLARDAMKRWQSARDFASALRTAAALPPKGQTPELSSLSMPPTPAQRVLATASPLAQFTPAAGQLAVPTPAKAPAPFTPAVGPSTKPPVVVTPVAPATPQPIPLQPPIALTAPQPPAPAPAKKSNTTRTVLIVLGVFALFSCCVCGSFVNQFNQAQRQHQRPFNSGE